jgi:hypothetical protein
VDAETLAAWSARALSSQQTQAVESHLADCARCQAMMAAFARSEPVAAAVLPFRRPWSVRWLVPLAAGTLAASLLIWVAWPAAPTAPVPVQTMARSEAREAGAPAPPSAPMPTMVDRAAADEKKADRRDRAQGKPERALPPSLPTAAPSGAPGQTIPLSSPTTPPPAAAAAPLRTQTAVATGQVQQRPAGLPQSAANVAPVTDLARAAGEAVAATVVTEFGFSDVPRPGAPAGAAGAAGGGGGGRSGGGAGGGRGGRIVGGIAGGIVGGIPPAPPLRWRVLSSGVVERSATAGASWERVAIDPPDLKVTGGAAPAPLVCWLVGREGVVLLSVDGLHFTRAEVPAAVDLSSIRAASAREATVTAIDGRVFVTTDGGQTWVAKTETDTGSRFSV